MSHPRGIQTVSNTKKVGANLKRVLPVPKPEVQEAMIFQLRKIAPSPSPSASPSPSPSQGKGQGKGQGKRSSLRMFCAQMWDGCSPYAAELPLIEGLQHGVVIDVLKYTDISLANAEIKVLKIYEYSILGYCASHLERPVEFHLYHAIKGRRDQAQAQAQALAEAEEGKNY